MVAILPEVELCDEEVVACGVFESDVAVVVESLTTVFFLSSDPLEVAICAGEDLAFLVFKIDLIGVESLLVVIKFSVIEVTL